MDYKNYILHFTSFYGSWGAHLLILDARGVGGGTPIWSRRGCSSEILNLTPKGDRLGVPQAFCDP